MPLKPNEGLPNGLADYWAIVQRRYWWILLPLFFCWLGVWVFSWFLPATFRSEALILVEQQKVPENYVASNVSVNLQDRLQSMTQQILSRTRLQTTIDRFHLYRGNRGILGGFARPKDPIDLMRNDITIDLVRSPEHPGELTAFKIQYSTGSSELAQQINGELTSLFIDENLKEQQQQSEGTTAFLNTQLAEARSKLEEQETTVQAFKAAHFGDLPSQTQTNVQILSGLQSQLQATQRDLDTAKQQKLYLDSLLQQYQSQHSDRSKGDSPDKLDDELGELRKRLATAQVKYTDDHPDVIALRDEIAKREKLRQQSEAEAELAASQTTDKGQAAVGNGAGISHAGTTPTTMQIQSQLKVNGLEIDNLQKQEKGIQTQIGSYQARLNLTPRTEQELTEISRGYEESMSNYNSLLQKQMQSQLATSLEQRQQGQQFRILDPPSLPAKPISPNHLKWSLGGLALGGLLGLGITALLEMAQERVWHAKDLGKHIPPRLLVVIPRLTTEKEDRRRAVIRFGQIAVTAAMILLIAAGNFYAFYRG